MTITRSEVRKFYLEDIRYLGNKKFHYGECEKKIIFIMKKKLPYKLSFEVCRIYSLYTNAFQPIDLN